MKGFSENLQMMRGERSQNGFAALLGISNQVTYHRYEHGRVPRAPVLLAIATRLQITVDELLNPMTKARAAELGESLAARMRDGVATAVVAAIAETLASEVIISEADHDRGFIEIPLEYRRGSVPKGFPVKLRVQRLSAREGQQILREAVNRKDAYLVMLAALPADWRADTFLDKLAASALHRLVKAAFILAYGQADAKKYLGKLDYPYDAGKK